MAIFCNFSYLGDDFPLFQSLNVDGGIPVAFATSELLTPVEFNNSKDLSYILWSPSKNLENLKICVDNLEILIYSNNVVRKSKLKTPILYIFSSQVNYI